MYRCLFKPRLIVRGWTKSNSYGLKCGLASMPLLRFVAICVALVAVDAQQLIRQATTQQAIGDASVVQTEELRRSEATSATMQPQQIEISSAHEWQKAESRIESWAVAFSETLRQEVETADADQALQSVLPSVLMQLGTHWTDWYYMYPNCYTNERGAPAQGLDLVFLGGDQVGHLLWRLENGQLPRKPAKLFVLLIGTNDLGAVGCNGYSAEVIAEEAEGVIFRVGEVVDLIQSRHPNASILVEGVFPRSSTWTTYDWPSVYTPAIEAVNEGLEKLAQKDKRVHYNDCGSSSLLPPTKDGIDARIMPDGLHPLASGLEQYAQCLSPVIDELMKEA